MDTLRSLTGSGGLAHKRHQLLFDLLEGVQVVHEEDVSVAGFTGDAHQLSVVGISEADSKHDVPFRGRQRGKKRSASTRKQTNLLMFHMKASPAQL